MPAKFLIHHLLVTRRWSIHGVLAMLTLAVIVLTPNADLLPEAWSGNLYNEKRIWEVLLLCTYALAMIVSPTARASWCATLSALPLAARAGFTIVLGLGLISAFLAARPDAALLEAVTLGLLFVLTLGIGTWAREDQRTMASLFVWGLAAMALVYGVRFIMGVMVIALEQAHLPISNLFLGFVNLRFFNQVQTWTLPLLALPPLWLAGRFPALRFIAFATLVLWWILLFIAAGRGALLATCGGIILTCAVFRNRSLPWLKTQLLATMVGLIAYFALSHSIFSSSPDSSLYLGAQSLPHRLTHAFEDSARLLLWNDAWYLFLQNPVFGAGPMHYAYYFHDAPLHPHNSLLQLLSEWGLPASLLLSLLCVWGLSVWIKQALYAVQPSDDHAISIRVALLASVGGAAMHSLVSGIIVMPLSQLLAACVIGLMLGNHLAARSMSTIAPSNKQHDIGFVAILAVAVLALGCLTSITLFESKGSLSTAGQVLHNPRFWLPGHLEPVEENILSRILRSTN